MGPKSDSALAARVGRMDTYGRLVRNIFLMFLLGGLALGLLGVAVWMLSMAATEGTAPTSTFILAFCGVSVLGSAGTFARLALSGSQGQHRGTSEAARTPVRTPAATTSQTVIVKCAAGQQPRIAQHVYCRPRRHLVRFAPSSQVRLQT